MNGEGERGNYMQLNAPHIFYLNHNNNKLERKKVSRVRVLSGYEGYICAKVGEGV